MIEYRHFALPGQIFLLNGYVEEWIDGERYVEYEDVSGLERAIGGVLASTPGRFSGAQVRFLRRSAGLTQEELAVAYGCDAQTIARYEKKQAEVPRALELTVRVEVLSRSELPYDARQIRHFVDNVADEAQRAFLSFSHPNGWTHRKESISRTSVSGQSSINICTHTSAPATSLKEENFIFRTKNQRYLGLRRGTKVIAPALDLPGREFAKTVASVVVDRTSPAASYAKISSVQGQQGQRFRALPN